MAAEYTSSSAIAERLHCRVG